MELAFKSIIEIQADIRNKTLTSEQVWEYFQKRIEKYDPKLQSFNSINTSWYNPNPGILAGIPLAIKDIYCEKWILTTGSSLMLEHFIPPYNATLIEKLKNEWMWSLGKLNMDEFAMGSSTENSALRKTLNPWGTKRIPGGSSGGSAAAVAAGLCPAALWTDTGGSLRQPAAMCGVIGFRPSYGRNSRFGIMPMASSLDCPGTITRTVRDAALLYEVMNGEDPMDSTTVRGINTIDPDIWMKKDLKGKKIGIPKEYFEVGLDAGVKKAIEKAIETLRELGAEIVDISLPMTKYAVAAYYIIVPAEVSTNLARLDGIRYGHNSSEINKGLEEIYKNNRGEWLWNEAKRRSILWSYVLSAGFYDAYFTKAAQIRTLIIEDFQKAFQQVDIILSPVTPSVAWKIGEKIDDPLKMYLEDAYTIPASLAGLPGMSIPCGFSQSEDSEQELLPVGLQILGPRLGEQKIFEIAYMYEQASDWRKKMIPEKYVN
jgi:aspartyl-tRNA(Asn)/glutamyl-tRNA(Gln) amidotransferase subunit A